MRRWRFSIGMAFVLFISLLYCSAWANPSTETKRIAVKSGTGFFISENGYIITCAHVIQACQTVYIRGAVRPSSAKVIARDAEKDIALLKTEVRPKRVAALRANYTWDKPMKVGDSVVVIGYPLERAQTGIYKVVEAKVVGLTGPLNEPDWIQFSNSTQKGNSGGPLLDTNGHVIGVIVGKATLMSRNRLTQEETVLRKSDIAVSLRVLKNFLQKQGLFFRHFSTYQSLSADQIENEAKGYIVNVHCPQYTARKSKREIGVS